MYMYKTINIVCNMSFIRRLQSMHMYIQCTFHGIVCAIVEFTQKNVVLNRFSAAVRAQLDLKDQREPAAIHMLIYLKSKE